MDGYTASRIVEAAESVNRPGHARRVDTEAAEQAVAKTSPQLTAWLARRVARWTGAESAARHARAVGSGGWGVQLDLDGMGSLWAMTKRWT
jgi:hypothetical protein